MHKIIMIQVEADDNRAKQLAEDVTFYIALDEHPVKSTLVTVADITPHANKVVRVGTARPNDQRIRLAKPIATGTRAGDWYYLPGQPEPQAAPEGGTLTVKTLEEMSSTDWALIEFPSNYTVQRVRNEVLSLSDQDRNQLFWELLRGRK